LPFPAACCTLKKICRGRRGPARDRPVTWLRRGRIGRPEPPSAGTGRAASRRRAACRVVKRHRATPETGPPGIPTPTGEPWRNDSPTHGTSCRTSFSICAGCLRTSRPPERIRTAPGASGASPNLSGRPREASPGNAGAAPPPEPGRRPRDPSGRKNPVRTPPALPAHLRRRAPPGPAGPRAPTGPALPAADGPLLQAPVQAPALAPATVPAAAPGPGLPPPAAPGRTDTPRRVAPLQATPEPAGTLRPGLPPSAAPGPAAAARPGPPGRIRLPATFPGAGGGRAGPPRALLPALPPENPRTPGRAGLAGASGERRPNPPARRASSARSSRARTPMARSSAIGPGGRAAAPATRITGNAPTNHRSAPAA